MQKKSLSLFVLIENHKITFGVGSKDKNENFYLVEEEIITNIGINHKENFDYNLLLEEFKQKIFLIEKKINFIFKDVILIINDFESSLISLSGYKKLNGSQLKKENVTYILNSLKSKVNETEQDKYIVHIFNTNFLLDKKYIHNLPIGLFGDFYTQELSFFLLKENYYKNLKNIFSKCNLKIKKTISKSFIDGVNLINKNSNLETFFKIEIDTNNSQIIFFEKSSLKFVQNFKFGSNLINKDISKITLLKENVINKILLDSDISLQSSGQEYIDKKFFQNDNYRKVKKKLFTEIVEARIAEFSEIILTKNINVLFFLKKKAPVYLSIKEKIHEKCFKDLYTNFFSNNKNLDLKLIYNPSSESLFKNANEIVQFGWKKEAVPVVHQKKTMIAKIFDIFFKE